MARTQRTTRIRRQNVTYVTGTLSKHEPPLPKLTQAPVPNTNTENTTQTASEEVLIPNNNYRVFTPPSLTDAITLRPGQHVVVNGQRFILRGIPTNWAQFPRYNKILTLTCAFPRKKSPAKTALTNSIIATSSLNLMSPMRNQHKGTKK
jgi:hypothetical protein